MEYWNDLRLRLPAWREERIERSAAEAKRRNRQMMDPSFWAAVDAVDWASYDLPIQDYHRGYYDIPEILEYVVNANRNVSDALWAALGCDYCGVFYPVVVPATPLLIRVALEGSRWPPRWRFSPMLCPG